MPTIWCIFTTARAEGDSAAAERAAHTLKGVAGNIGAKAVQTAAAELEQACQRGATDDIIADLLAKTLTRLAPVIAGLDGLDGAASAVGRPPAQALLEQLQSLLKESNAEAEDVALALLDAVKGGELENSIRKIAGRLGIRFRRRSGDDRGAAGRGGVIKPG